MIKKSHFAIAFLPLIILLGYFLVDILQKNYKESLENEKAYRNQRTLDLVPIFPGDPLLGDARASITIIAFQDLGCPDCSDQNEFFKQLLEKHPNVFKIVWKGLPVTKYPVDSRKANEMAYCAHKLGKFTNFKNYAYANLDNLSDTVLQTIIEATKINPEAMTTCLEEGYGTKKIEEVESIAREISIQSVPTLFVNNRQLVLPNTLEAWEEFFELNL